MHLSVSTALATMRAIPEYLSADYDALGILPEDFNLVHGDSIWRSEHRVRVSRTLEGLLYGVTSMLGLGRLSVPAEYVAAIIATLVGPANRQTACIWLAEIGGTGARSLDLAAAKAAGEVDVVGASQLFALVLELSSTDESNSVRQRFTDRLTKAARVAQSAITKQ